VLELGGNAGVIVDRGTNLEFAVKRIAQGAYGNAGQSCIAVQRVFIHEDIYGEFEQQFLDVSQSLFVGDPLDDRTIVGPMIDEEAAQKVEGWINEARAGGARVLCGGTREGAVLSPTVLVDVKPEMKVSCQEIFAPVVTLEKFTDFKQAIAMVNDSAYGLQAGLFTIDINRAFSAYQELEVGGVIINDFPTYRIDHMPYGGVKDSGFGREGIKYAIEEMTEMKLMALNFP
jgi:acyl-CoA reductase-like NAD-dependent aldehyde dehydrogenase